METIVKEINGKAIKIPMSDIVNYMQKLFLLIIKIKKRVI